MLEHIVHVVDGAENMITDGYAAEATIKVPKTNKMYEKWAAGEAHAKHRKVYIKNELRPEHWYDVAEDSKSHTKVKIIFLKAFTDFINSLSAE